MQARIEGAIVALSNTEEVTTSQPASGMMQLLTLRAKEILCGPIVKNMVNFSLQTYVCSLPLQAHIELWPFLSGQGSQDAFHEDTSWSRTDLLVIDLLKAHTFELTMKRRASVCIALLWAPNSWSKTLRLIMTNSRAGIQHVSYDALPLF